MPVNQRESPKVAVGAREAINACGELVRQRSQVQQCDKAYPGICIPPNSVDLNCSDIPYCRFKVIPPDPHGFNRDKDGVGC